MNLHKCVSSSPFDRVLKESFHFWERRHNSDIQSFHLVFPVWIPPESERERDSHPLSLLSSHTVQYRSREVPTVICPVQKSASRLSATPRGAGEASLCFTKTFHPPPLKVLSWRKTWKSSNCLIPSSPLLLPFQRCEVEMQQSRAVFAPVEADADFLCGILIQCRFYRFQRRQNLRTQWCACGETKSTCFTLNVDIFFFVRSLNVAMLACFVGYITLTKGVDGTDTTAQCWFTFSNDPLITDNSWLIGQAELCQLCALM